MVTPLVPNDAPETTMSGEGDRDGGRDAAERGGKDSTRGAISKVVEAVVVIVDVGKMDDVGWVPVCVTGWCCDNLRLRARPAKCIGLGGSDEFTIYDRSQVSQVNHT
jgi:hypothetical protein